MCLIIAMPWPRVEAMYGWANNRQSGTYTKKARAFVLATKGFERIAETLVAAKVLTETAQPCRTLKAGCRRCDNFGQ